MRCTVITDDDTALTVATESSEFMERAMGIWESNNRTHVRSLGSLFYNSKNAQIGGNLTFTEILKWIAIATAVESRISVASRPPVSGGKVLYCQACDNLNVNEPRQRTRK
jgi:hypothetical protein